MRSQVQPLRVLIVDDEPPARRKLERFLRRDERVHIVGEAEDGEAAVLQIEKLSPDLVLLDIQMPRLNGFEVLEAIGEDRPQIIFTTAFDQYAIAAFEVRALDYLLKPFDEDRLGEALNRAIEERRTGDPTAQKIDDLLKELRRQHPVLRRIPIKTPGRIIFIDTNEIDWIESEEKYVRLHTGKRSYLHRMTLTHLEERLDPAVFIRVHRRQIVNVSAVRELQAISHGDYSIILHSGEQIPLGRTFREHFLEAFSAAPSSGRPGN